MKICKICGEEKDNFRKMRKIVNKKEYVFYDSYCNECRKKYRREYQRKYRYIGG